MTMEIDRTAELAVNGMTCGHRVASVTEELEAVDGVKHVDVILESGGTSKVTVLLTPSSTTTRSAKPSPRPDSNSSASRATSDPSGPKPAPSRHRTGDASRPLSRPRPAAPRTRPNPRTRPPDLFANAPDRGRRKPHRALLRSDHRPQERHPHRRRSARAPAPARASSSRFLISSG